MSRGPLLFANLGAEEGADWERTLALAPVASAARLWRLLFPAGTPAVGDERRGDAPVSADDPGASPEPAFDWLEGEACFVAWLTNPAAWQTASDAGVPLRGAPGDVTMRVNDKAFALSAAERDGFVPRPLRGTSVALEPEVLADVDTLRARIHAATSAWPAFARAAFTLKPRLGTSGRGRIDGRVDKDGPSLSALRSAPKLARAGGAILEPWLDRDRDFSAQLRIADDGAITLLGTLEQRTSPRGAVQGHRGEIDSRGRIFSGLPEDEDVREAAAAVAGSAAREGYVGPCGVDGFTFHWRDDAGNARTTLRPIVELNARFTMGIVSLGLARRGLGRVREHLGLRPGDRRAFEIRFDAPLCGWDAARGRAGEGAFLTPLHREGDAVEPAILYARTRADLDRAFGGDASSPAEEQRPA